MGRDSHHTRSHAPLSEQSGPAVTQVQQKAKLKPTEKKRPWGTVPKGSAESMERVPVRKPAAKVADEPADSSGGSGKTSAPADISTAADSSTAADNSGKAATANPAASEDEGSFEGDIAEETRAPARG